MPIKVTCSSCNGVLHAPDDSAGKRGRCPTCGMILSIPMDAPRVAADAPPAPFGIPPSQESLAFPRPPAFGESKGYTSGATPTSSKLPPDPRQYNDPFAKTAAPAPSPSETTARAWAKVDRGLGLIRLAAVVITLGVLIPSGLVIAEQNGVALPQKPGVLGIANVGLITEVKVLSPVVLFALGGLLFNLGRFSVAAVPRETGVKFLATCAALMTLVSFLGYMTAVGIGVKTALAGQVPQFVPTPETMAKPFFESVTAYGQQVFTSGPEGQIQRFAAGLFLAAAIISDLWLLGTLSRLAGWLRHPAAIARTNRFAVLAGLFLFLVPILMLGYDTLGRAPADAQWNNLASPLKETLRSATAAVVFTVLAFFYTRSLRGLRTAIRETAA